MDRSLTGAVLIGVILLFRRIGRNLVPKRIICMLWTAAALYLLLPIQIPSPINIYALFSGNPAGAGRKIVRSVQSGIQLRAGETAELARTAEKAVGGDPLQLLYILVCGGIGLWLLTAFCIGMLRLHRGSPVRHPYLSKWQAQYPLRRPLQILCSTHISVPVSGGLLFPVILLPEDCEKCSDSELECILTHEYIHICGFDPLWKLLYSACLCLYWFHPAVWIMVLLAGRDTEYACDEAVLATGICSKDYGASLIRMELRKAAGPILVNSFTAGGLLKRVNRICADRGRQFWTWSAGLLAAVGILAVFATGPATAASVPISENVSFFNAAEQLEPAKQIGIPTEKIGSGYRYETELRQMNALGESVPAFDVYSGFLFLGERIALNDTQIEEAMRELTETFHPHLLRVTESGDCYKVRVYDFPAANGDGS